MKIKLKNVEKILKNNTENMEQDDFLCFIPENMFGTTVDCTEHKHHNNGEKTYMTTNSYMVPSDFVEEVIND